MPTGNLGWRKRVLQHLRDTSRFSGNSGINVHYSYEYEVARIMKHGNGYKMRFLNGPYSTIVRNNMEVLKALEGAMEPLDKRRIQVFYG